MIISMLLTLMLLFLPQMAIDASNPIVIVIVIMSHFTSLCLGKENGGFICSPLCTTLCHFFFLKVAP